MLRNSGLSHCAKSTLSRPEKTMKEIMSPREKVGGGVLEEKTHSGSCSPWRVTVAARDTMQSAERGR